MDIIVIRVSLLKQLKTTDNESLPDNTDNYE